MYNNTGKTIGGAWLEGLEEELVEQYRKKVNELDEYYKGVCSGHNSAMFSLYAKLMKLVKEVQPHSDELYQRFHKEIWNMTIGSQINQLNIIR